MRLAEAMNQVRITDSLITGRKIKRSIQAGGPGSGCDPAVAEANGTKCGRPEGTGSPQIDKDRAKFHEFKARWAKVNNELLEYIDNPNAPQAAAKVDELKAIVKQMNTLEADRGTLEDIGMPGGPKDIVVVGAGPGGLAASVMGATDGLDTMFIDAQTQIGGQSKFSSRIENFPGFPIGITGAQLAKNMYDQATRLGADYRLGVRVTAMDFDPVTQMKTLHLSNGEHIQARAVIIAGGIEFKKMEFPGADSPHVIIGDGEKLAKISVNKPCVVVGGSNGAAQAALGVARTADHVYLLSRSPITKGMSDYQVQAVKNNPKITVIEGDEIAKLWLDEQQTPHTLETMNGRKLKANAVGIFVGGGPRTEWIPQQVKRQQGKIVVNNELETDLPGVFAVGDNRVGSIGRIGAAVGDGQMAERGVFSYFERLKQRTEANP